MSKEPTISCPVCGKHFRNQSGLINHYRYKHPEAKSPAAASAPLRKAARISCPVCGKHFQNQSGLANHHRYKHPEAKSLAATSAPGAPAHAANTGVQGPGKAKELVCAHCDKAFARASSLSTHMRYRHPGKARVATALPAATSAKTSIPATVPVVAGVQEHLKTALQELTQRQRDIDEQLSQIESLQSEKEAMSKQIAAVRTALQAFER
jgi:uncharacterized Zn-finger protein